MGMFPEPIVRNTDGSYYHPAYVAFCDGRESISFNELDDWLDGLGLECAFIEFDQEPDTEAAREYATNASFTTWQPEQPAGDGWFIASIHESEDGPQCIWVRPSVYGELNAAQNTLSAARDSSGCPDGVDLKDHLQLLVAESVELKRVPENNSVAMLLALDAMKSTALPDVGFQLAFSTLLNNRKTPALSLAIGAIEARGVERAARELERIDTIAGTRVMAFKLRECAQLLREGKA